MKIIAWDEKHGKVLVRVEGQDDLWCLYNVLRTGDTVTAKTLREVKVDDKSARKPMTLKIRVENVEFQPFTDRLRVRGVVVEGPEDYGVVGSHHTITIRENTELLIEKEKWSKHEIDRIRRACTRKFIDVLLIGVDSDEAAFVIPHDYGLELLAEVQLMLPGKHEPLKRERALKNKIQELAEKARELVDRLGIKALVVVGPGFMKDELAKKLISELNVKVYVENASSGGYHGVKEAVRRGALNKVLRDFEIVEEAKLINELLMHISKGDGMVAYGIEDVERASEYGAVDKLLVLDELVRSPNTNLRRKIEEIIEKAEERGARVKMFNALEEPGQQLKSLGGLAAILRFSLDLEE